MALLLGGLALAVGLQVVGDCPSQAAVAAQLQPMLPRAAEMPVLRARVEQLFDMVRVEVRGEDGALLTVKDLRVGTPCAELAAVAAIYIASAISSAPRPLEPPLLLPPPPRVQRQPPPPPPHFDVGLGVLLAMSSAAGAPGGLLALSVAPAGKPLGAQLLLVGTALRTLALGEGEVQWTRAQLWAGPRYRFSPGRLCLDLSAALGAAMLYASGAGYPFSYSRYGFDVGLLGGVRGGVRLGRLLPWISLNLAGFLRPQELVVLDPSARTQVPAFEVQLGAGLSIGRLR